ncbi:GMC oxidoreductase [Cohnella suwonensis]|uniref:GMC oxidoreductase n=1 Tax=Cohnella suwonensis TaxID=696072 RepID=A0ABW0LZK7_9BACL
MRIYIGNSPMKIPMCPPPPVYRNEQWIPLTSLEDMQETDYDVLIVGSGAGGGAVLWRLMNQIGGSGKRIGIVERGGLLLPTHAQNIATMNGERFDKYFSSAAAIPPRYPSPQIYALGGRTLFWATVSPRMHAADLASWPVPLKEMDIYYGIAEKVMSVTQNFTKRASLTQILLNRLQKDGFPDATDEPLAINLESINQYGVVNSNPYFSSLVFFAQALNSPFDLAVNARAVEVLTEKDRVVGVKVMSPEKKSYFLKAKKVVLSASTFGTTQILLNSGLRNSAIGHYMTIHSRVFGKGIANRNEFPEALGPLHILIPGTEDRSYQIQIWGPGAYPTVQYQVEPLKREWEISFYASGRVESRFGNQVTLHPFKRDEYGVPEIQIDFSFNEQDEAVIRQMGEGVKRAAKAMGTPLVSKDGQPPICLWRPGMELHEMGTCRMGEDPSDSSTDRYGQVYGVQGLYVADNSVIPTSGTANPTLTTVALAIRTADHIIRQLK